MGMMRHRMGLRIEAPDSIGTGDLVGKFLVDQPIEDAIKGYPLYRAVIYTNGLFNFIMGEGMFSRK